MALKINMASSKILTIASPSRLRHSVGQEEIRHVDKQILFMTKSFHSDNIW